MIMIMCWPGIVSGELESRVNGTGTAEGGMEGITLNRMKRVE